MIRGAFYYRKYCIVLQNSYIITVWLTQNNIKYWSDYLNEMIIFCFFPKKKIEIVTVKFCCFFFRGGYRHFSQWNRLFNSHFNVFDVNVIVLNALLCNFSRTCTMFIDYDAHKWCIFSMMMLLLLFLVLFVMTLNHIKPRKSDYFSVKLKKNNPRTTSCIIRFEYPKCNLCVTQK